MYKYIISSFICLSLFIPCNASSEVLNLMKHQGPDYSIVYEEALRDPATKILDIYPDVKADLQEKLGLSIGFEPTIMLIQNDSEFRRLAGGNELVTAFALPNHNRMIINHSKMAGLHLRFKLTIEHELTHLLLAQYIPGDNLPKWLNEGVSQWVSNGMTDILQFDSTKLLRKRVLAGKYIPLNELNSVFPKEPESFQLSYEQSRSFVEYLEDRFGSEGVLKILESLHNGDNINTALTDNFGADLNQLENDWHDNLRNKYTWFIFISNNLYWLIFVFGAVIAFLGYVKLRIRMKTHFKDDDDDDPDNELYDSREPEEVKPWE